MTSVPVIDIITKDEPKILVTEAEKLGKSLTKELKTNQIRAIFGEARQIEGMWQGDEESKERAYRRLVLLKPKMVYRARKESGRAVQQLVDVLIPALEAVVNEQDKDLRYKNFKRFMEFFEAILAYHQGYGGK